MRLLSTALMLACIISACIISACKYIPSFSEIATRSASRESALPVKEPCMLALNNGRACRMSTQRCEQALSVLSEVKNRPLASQKEILKDAFVQKVTAQKISSAELCETELERWALNTIALGKSAPYDVAALIIPGLQEIKFLVWGGGMMAGFLGDGVGSACMSAVGASISYAESKQWIACKR